MGRQAYLSRLALGRSAFEAPLRDEDGEFIIGQHARRLDTIGYEQQWDQSGHPQNLESDSRAKKFRRAQNEVLEACGVIVRRDAAKKSQWEKMTYEDKMQSIRSENRVGFIFRRLDRLAGIVASWWIITLRQRMMISSTYPDSSLAARAWSDIRNYGFLGFLFAGLPAFLVTVQGKLMRYYARDPDVEDMVDYVKPQLIACTTTRSACVIDTLEHLAIFIVEWPIEVFSMLQSIHLTRQWAIMNPWTLVPFSVYSPIQVPRMPLHLTTTTIFYLVWNIFTSPIVVAVLRDYLQVQLGFRTYALIRQLAVKPDQPDKCSAEAADEDELIDHTSIPGLGYRIDSGSDRRFFGARTLYDALVVAFPTTFYLWHRLLGRKRQPHKARIEPESHLEVRDDVVRHYQSLLRGVSPRPHRGSEHDILLRRDAILATFRRLGIDIEANAIDVDEWADDIGDETHSEGLTETPDTEPELLDIPAIVHPSNSIVDHALDMINETGTDLEHVLATSIELDGPTPSTTDTGIVPAPSDGSESPAVTIADSSSALIAMDSGLGEVPDPPQLPATPEPVLRRAASLSLANPRPVRRPTETGQTGLEESVLSSFREHAIRERRRRRGKWRTVVDQNVYRTTLLSTFCADSFAWHASALITNLALLPLETFYIRLITRWFFVSAIIPQQTRGADDFTNLSLTGYNGQFAPVAQSLYGNFNRAEGIVLSIGLEMVVRGLVWRLGTGITKYYGQTRYGWGKF